MVGQRKNELINPGLLFLIPIVPVFQYSIILFFGTAGGAGGGGATTAGGAGGALKLSAAGKGESRHHPVNFLALTCGAGNLFGGIQYQFFKFVLALVTTIFINRHFTTSLRRYRNIF
jgi:hypothetical protein